MIWWTGSVKAAEYEQQILNGNWVFKRYGTVYQNANIFGSSGEPLYTDVKSTRHSYMMATLAALVISYPQFIKDVFINTQVSQGIFGLKFQIKNKPWIITIDDEFAFTRENTLVYAQSNGIAMWPALIEKGIAKVVGNYDKLGEDGNPLNVISVMTGLSMSYINLNNV